MSARMLVRSGLEWCGAVFLVVVLLPLAAIALFVLRFAVLGVLALALTGMALGLCVCRPLRCRIREVLGLDTELTEAH